MLRALLIATVLVSAIGMSKGCYIDGFEVTQAAVAFKPADSNVYSLADVREHFAQMQPINYIYNTNTTYTCVDARGGDSSLSTPG